MGVDPHRPRLDPPRQAMRVGEGSGPDARGEAVGAVVRLPDHGIEVAIAMDDEHRAEDLFPRNAVASCDIRDDRRREEGARLAQAIAAADRSEEHTSELQSLMRTSYAVFCLKKKTANTYNTRKTPKLHDTHS